MRPIEFFLSHQNGDREDVVDLEGAMRRRGLASWRDRRSLLAGDDNDRAIRSGIDDGTNGFVLYGSDRVVTSWYVWNREWPWAHERREREKATGHPAPYRIAPLFVDGLDYRMLRQAALAAGQPDPTTVNGEQLRRDDAAGRDRVARWLLRGAVADRAAIHDGPIRIRLTTFADPKDVDADMLVDWSPEFASDPVDWPALRVALGDLKDELAQLGRPIEVDVQARLIPAFVFGHAFPLAARIPLVGVHRDGQRWTMRADADPALVCLTLEPADGGDPSVAVVEVSLTREVGVAAAAAVAGLGLRPGKVMRLGFALGRPSVDADVAAAAALEFGRAIRTLRDAGIREAHLFLAAPAALSVLLGASVNAGPALTLYFAREGAYVPGLRLP